MKLLVTGGAGFIGSSFVRYVLRTRRDIEVLNLDLLTYAGNLRNLEEIADDPRYGFIRGDIADPKKVARSFRSIPSMRSSTSQLKHMWTDLLWIRPHSSARTSKELAAFWNRRDSIKFPDSFRSRPMKFTAALDRPVRFAKTVLSTQAALTPRAKPRQTCLCSLTTGHMGCRF